MSRLVMGVAAITGGIAVAAGAFGAHALEQVLEASGQADNWDTAARYALFHSLAALVAGIVASLPQSAAGRAPALWAGACFLVGTAIFSGCLGALALSGVKVLGAIVPIGGTILIVGWGLLATAGFRMSG